MSLTTIYHYPACSKSRATLALLRAHAIEPEIILYREQPPTAATIRHLAKQLGFSRRDLMRVTEPRLVELKLDVRDLEAMDEEVLSTLIANNPELLQRPIVVHNGVAAIGRPPEKVLTLFAPL